MIKEKKIACVAEQTEMIEQKMIQKKENIFVSCSELDYVGFDQ